MDEPGEDEPQLRTATSLLLTTQRAAPRQSFYLIHFFSVFSPLVLTMASLSAGTPMLAHVIFFGSLKEKVAFASHVGSSPLNPVFPHS